MRIGLVIVQGLSFVALGSYFAVQGAWRLAVAQLLLAAVQVIVYL